MRNEVFSFEGGIEMLNFKSIIRMPFLAIGILSAFSVSAYTPAPSVSSTGEGVSVLAFAGANISCHATLTISVTSTGAALISGATFIGDPTPTLCVGVTGNATPWSIGTATLVSGSVYSATVSNVSVTAPALHITCTGSVTMTLDNSTGMASFNGTLHFGVTPCGFSGTGLTTMVRAP